jgi:hypothetical protein
MFCTSEYKMTGTVTGFYCFWTQASLISEMMRSYKHFLHVGKMLILTYNYISSLLKKKTRNFNLEDYS